MRDLLRLSVLCMAMAIGAVATAHHGTSLYDMDQEIVLKDTIGGVLWIALFDAVHHRGQLSTYIRPMGGTVPSIYGPSADAPAREPKPE